MGGNILVHNLEIAVYISVNNSKGLMLLKAALESPGQKKRVLRWQICSSISWCGKNDELSVWQMDVKESSFFKGNSLYWGRGGEVNGHQGMNVVKCPSST